MGGDVPHTPLIFFKPNTAVVGPDDPIVLPEWSAEVSFEGELAVIIGRICKDVPVERVNEVVLGYTAANDVTARDAQRTDGQWARAKGFEDRKSTRLNSSHVAISYAVFCLKKIIL